MGVDIIGIIKHELTIEEAVNLPDTINTWSDVLEAKKSKKYEYQEYLDNQVKNKSKWSCEKEVNPIALQGIWESLRVNKPRPKELYGYDNWIDCFIGTIKVYENSIIISHLPEHRYANIKNKETAQRILKCNKLIAKHLRADEILYCPDSSFPTAVIEDWSIEGKRYEEVKQRAIELFGKPPDSINDGRKYMFFFDYVNARVEDITEWGDCTGYWKFDEKINDYKLDKDFRK